MSFSCMKEYDVVTVENQRDFLPKPTRTEVSSGNDSLMVLGPQQTNPYTVSIMQEARRLLLEENPGLEIPELTVSHYYVRFAPRDDDKEIFMRVKTQYALSCKTEISVSFDDCY